MYDNKSKQNDNIIIRGSYPVNKEHKLTDSVLQQAIDSYEAAAIRFSMDAIKDAKVRQSYMSNIRRISEQVKKEVAARNCTVKEGAEFCNEMRNKIMAEHRKFSSAQGRAFTEKQKPKGLNMQKAINMYSKDKFSKPFSSLSQSEKNAVYYEIIESSARDNVTFTAKTKKLKIMGKVGILVTGALAAYEIVNADNKPKETVRLGLILSGGAVGGLMAGLGVSSICGAGAPICAMAVVLLGSVGGGLIGEAVANTFDEELEEFSKWTIH